MRKRPRRREGYGPRGSSPPWMLTYGDMVTLLLTLFVMLYAFSQVDLQKFEMVLVSLQGAFGVLRGGGGGVELGPVTEPEEVPGEQPFQVDWQQLRAASESLAEAVARAGLSGQVQLQMEERGLVVRFADAVLFDLGRAELKPAARAILDEVARVVRPLPNPIRVEGHTDDLPISTVRFPSNWELSTARATTVVRYFIEHHGFPPGRLSAAGYGEHKPVAPNTSDENRRKNRRVDVVILFLSEAAQEPR
ncbi:MAG: OmpA family protein [Acetobacteraceae bacterium]|nr:OmpA family protein [Acetobacteraceae bacterium]